MSAARSEGGSGRSVVSESRSIFLCLKCFMLSMNFDNVYGSFSHKNV